MDQIPATQTTQAGLTNSDVQLVNRFFEDLKGIFTGWRNAWPTKKEQDSAKRAYAKAFMENGVRDWGYIEGGLRICRRHEIDFPPGAGKFLAWCRQARLEAAGVPTVEEAFKEACVWVGRPHEWSHNVVFHAACQTGHHELRSSTEREIFQKFEVCYNQAIEIFLAGGDLHVPRSRKELPREPEMTLEERKAALKKLREDCGI